MLKRGWQFGIGCALAWLSVALLYAVASYPSAVHAFPTRVDGQTIAASWFNEIHDEVVAIETALLNGFQHDLKFTDATYDIGKSGATRPRDGFFSRNVVVGGTFTPTGNVVSDLLFTDATYDIGKSGATRPRDGFFSRNLTAGGVATVPSGLVGAPSVAVGAATVGLYSSGANALDFSTNSTKALGITSAQIINSPTQPRAVAYNSGTQAVGSGAQTILTLDSEVVDVGNMHSTSVNTSRLTVPTGGDGFYWITGRTVAAVSAAGTVRQLHLYQSGVDQQQFDITTGLNSGNGVFLVVNAGAQAVAGDYFELYMYQDTGGNLNAGGTITIRTQLTAVKLW